MKKIASKLKLLLLLTVLLAGCVPVSRAQSLETTAAEPQIIPSEGPLSSLWIDMSMGPDLIDWFNRNARPDDIARVDHVSMIDQLDRVEVGKRLVVFKNVADAELLVPRLVDEMDVIGYNLEHGPTNRPDEQADPVGSIRRMRTLADSYDKELAFGPDRRFALSDGVAMAPYADIFVLQIQRAQTDPQAVREFVLPLIQQLRQANPELKISVQVRTEGDVMAIATLLASIEENLDGISILTSPETTDVAEALVAELRPPVTDTLTPTPQITPEPTPVLPSAEEPKIEEVQADSNLPSEGSLPVAPTQAQAAILPTPAIATRRLPVAEQEGTTTLVATESDNPDGLRRWVLLAGLFLTGLVVAVLVASVWVLTYQKSGS